MLRELTRTLSIRLPNSGNVRNDSGSATNGVNTDCSRCSSVFEGRGTSATDGEMLSRKESSISRHFFTRSSLPSCVKRAKMRATRSGISRWCSRMFLCLISDYCRFTGGDSAVLLFLKLLEIMPCPFFLGEFLRDLFRYLHVSRAEHTVIVNPRLRLTQRVTIALSITPRASCG